MKFTSKDYKINKIKNYLKRNKLFMFVTGTHQNSNEWIKTQQNFKNLNLNCYKISNKPSSKTFKNSIFINVEPVIKGVVFLINFQNSNINLFSKKSFFNISPFVFLALKFNNQIYSSSQTNYIKSFNYINTKLLLYKFGIVSIKLYLKQK